MVYMYLSGKCLFLSGLIPEQLNAYDDYKLVKYGIGFTNIVARTTRGSADLTRYITVFLATLNACTVLETWQQWKILLLREEKKKIIIALILLIFEYNCKKKKILKILKSKYKSYGTWKLIRIDSIVWLSW